MSNTMSDKIEKRRIYMRNYRLKKAGKLLVPIKEVENESEEVNTNELIIEGSTIPIHINDFSIMTQIPKKIPKKYLLIKPDFTLLIKHNKLHRKLMNELLRKTRFLQLLNKYDLVMMEFNEKKEMYIEYNNEYEYNNYEDNSCSRIIHVLVRTKSFIKWLNKFDLVMDEFIENQL